MTKFLYTFVVKDSNTPIQDLAHSRSEARECKALYEGIYKTKVNVVRYERPTNIR